MLTILQNINTRSMKSIYKTSKAKKKVLDLYDKKLKSLDFPIEEKDISTSYGTTRVIISGNPEGKEVVLFHGVHAGSPLTLECVKGLQNDYHFFAIDTIGQATKSADTSIKIKDDSFAIWADEVLDELAISNADFIGISYGAYILQKLIAHRPAKVGKCVLVVPSGLANGNFWTSFTKLSIPLIKFQITKKDKDLREFVKHFIAEDDNYMFEFQKAILTGVHLDYRRPQILQSKDVEHFTNPIYIIAADDDVFFPAEKVIARAKIVFKNLKEVYLLKDCKHIPYGAHFSEIENKIKQWIK